MAKSRSPAPTDDDLKRLAHCLRQAMGLMTTATGLSQNALFIKHNISKTSWHRLTGRSRRKPGLAKLGRLVRILEITDESWREHKLERVFPMPAECFARTSSQYLETYPSPLHYMNQLKEQPHGRDDEIALLSAFLNSSPRFSWWLITGREGAGKSRLAVHVANINTPAWETVHHKPHDGLLTQRLKGFKPRCNTLIVVDYAGMYPEEVRNEIEQVAGTALYYRVRVLLVERYFSQLDPAGGVHPAWYRTLLGGRQDSASVLGSAHSEVTRTSGGEIALRLPSLHLGALTERASKAVIAQTRKGLSIKAAGDIYKKIEQLASRAKDAAVHFQPLQLQVLAETLNTDSNAVTSLDEALSIRTARRMHYWHERLSQDGHSQLDCDKIYNMLFVATLCHGLHIRECSQSSIADLIPTQTQIGATRELLKVLDVGCDQSERILPLEPDLIGEWFVRVMVEGRPDTRYEQAWRPLAPDVTDRLMRWAFHSHPDSVKHFRGRIFPAFKDSYLWDRLTSIIGRYATPFGQLFDDPKWQAGFLAGQMEEAGTAYNAAVAGAIQVARAGSGQRPKRMPSILLVDLMAGGANRVKDLLKVHQDLRVLAVDQDTSRLSELQADWGEQLAIYRKSICGRCGLDAQLREAFRDARCDVVIARKALHELPWPQQQALIYEISEVLRPGGCLVLHVDGPHRMSKDGRLRYERLAAPLLTPDSPEPKAVRPLCDISLDGEDAAAIFINLWIKLKDWKSRNEHERRNRYFSSVEEIRRECDYHGLLPASSQSFTFDLHAARFNEDGINELHYISHRSPVEPSDFVRHVQVGNERYRVFVDFTERVLSKAAIGTAHMSSVAQAVGARPALFDMSDKFPEICWKTRGQLLVSGHAFRCPAHILVFEKASES